MLKWWVSRIWWLTAIFLTGMGGDVLWNRSCEPGEVWEQMTQSGTYVGSKRSLYICLGREKGVTWMPGEVEL